MNQRKATPTVHSPTNPPPDSTGIIQGPRKKLRQQLTFPSLCSYVVLCLGVTFLPYMFKGTLRFSFVLLVCMCTCKGIEIRGLSPSTSLPHRWLLIHTGGMHSTSQHDGHWSLRVELLVQHQVDFSSTVTCVVSSATGLYRRVVENNQSN